MTERPAKRGKNRRSRGPSASRPSGGSRVSRSSRDTHGPRSRVARADSTERLQKVLSRAGLASRREAEDWIRAGRLTVNGTPAELGAKVGPTDQIRLDGRLIKQRAPEAASRVFILHRSPGESLRQPPSDATPPAGNATPTLMAAVVDRLPRRAGKRFIAISPMPRVDGGMELLTGDGELAAKLQRAVRGMSSQFSVRVRGELSEPQLEGIRAGLLDSGEHLEVEGCEPSGGEAANRWYTLAARGASGKDVRQLFERQGALVSRVLRTQLGSLSLDRHLGRGQFRELTPEELASLLSAARPRVADT